MTILLLLPALQEIFMLESIYTPKSCISQESIPECTSLLHVETFLSSYNQRSLKTHIGHSFSHMLIELFRQFLIDRDTLLKAVETFIIIVIKILVHKTDIQYYANNNLSTSSTSSDSEIHLISVVSFYIFQFCRIRAARFLELQISGICRSLLLFLLFYPIFISRINI